MAKKNSLESYLKLLTKINIKYQERETINKNLMRSSNFVTKNIREFNKKDTLYLVKMVSGYQYMLLCKFIKFDKGIVTALPIAIDPYEGRGAYFGGFGKADEITARLRKCSLRNSLGRFCWFNRNGFAE